MDLDEILPDVGEFGTYQKMILYLVLLPGVFPCAFHAYNQIFMSAKPDHWCRVSKLERMNYSMDVIKNISIPIINLNGETRYEECVMYSRNHSSDIWDFTLKDVRSCNEGWIYDTSKYESTIVTEWDLVCSNDFYITLALVVFGVGGLIGNYVFGYIQDTFGRRPAFFIYLLIESVFSIRSAFAGSYFEWLLLRFGVGFTVPAILGTPYVLSVELVGPKKRATCTILLNVAYSLGLVSLAGVVYLFRDWRHLTLATTLPFLAFFLYWWILPESPRWLLTKGRFQEAEKILLKMAKINGKPLDDDYMVLLKKKFEEKRSVKIEAKRQYGVTDLFRHSNLRKKTLIITFIWFTNTAVYVGLSYYAPILGGDEFFNFFLAGIVELPTYTFLWLAIEKLGRRWTLFLSMVIGGVACLATVLSEKEPSITLALYCIGKMGISSSFVALPLMASELYPTVVRGIGISFSSVVGQIGPIAIPLINYLGEDWIVLPLLIMGSLLVIGGISSLLLPETLRQHLPQTLEDGENFGRDWSCVLHPEFFSRSDCRNDRKSPARNEEDIRIHSNQNKIAEVVL